MKTLVRAEVKVNDKGETLGERAARELSYTVLEAQTIPATVAACLAKLGLRPFDIETVNAYKSKMRREADVKAYKPAAIVAIVSVILPVIAALAAWHPAPLIFWMIGVAATLLVAVNITDWNWRQRKLSGYGLPVPAYALETACELKKLLSKAKIKHEFYVDELTRESVTADPFLVLNVGGSEIYLEVWDEPKFGGDRTV